MTDHHTTIGAKFVSFLTWLATALGLGTLIGIVNVSVGLLSAAWIVIQINNYYKYTLPINRAQITRDAARAKRTEQLQAARDTEGGDLDD